MSLYKRRFREEFPSLLTWSITLLLAGLAMMVFGLFFSHNTQLADNFAEIFAKMPGFLQNMIGIDFANFSALYLLGTAYNSIVPLLLLVFSSLTVLSLYTREAGQGNLEFLFSLPISRFRLISERILVFLANLGILHLCFGLGLVIGALCAGLKLDYTAVTWATVNLFLLYFCLGGFAFLLSLTVNDYSRGVLLVLGILMGLFILNLGVGDVQSVLSFPNPYHYFDVAPIFKDGSVPWTAFLGFSLAGLAFWTAGIGAYIRKQI